MANVFSLTSHVVYGHVGGQGAVPALHAMGHEVWHLPSVLFSNHPGHNGYEGAPVAVDLQNRLLDGFLERGFLSDCAAVHTGYLGLPDSVDVALRAIDAARVPVLCDPVLGDNGRLFVAEDIARAVRDRLLPRTSIATPNRFELTWLTGLKIDNLDDAVAASEELRRQGPEWVVCTSAWIDDGHLHDLAVGPDGAFQVRLPHYADDDAVPKGTGDAFAAILLGHVLLGQNVPTATAAAGSAVHGLIGASLAQGADELAIIGARDLITAPKRKFDVEPLA